MSKYLTVAEVADHWGVRREAIYRHIQAGELEAVDFSRPGAGRAFYKISRDSIEAFERRRSTAKPKAPTTPRIVTTVESFIM